ncbi:Cytochrome P450 9e2 [Blattella germanica]|nr:Cytochrome P450 9e2 [Blattella germanica]
MEFINIATWWPLGVILFGWMIYLYLTWNHNYWKKRGIPYAKPSLLFGNVKESTLFQKFIGDVYVELYKKFEGHKYAGIFEFGKPVLLIRDPEVIKDVLVREFSKFHDNEIFVDPDNDPMIGRNPFILRGER